MKIAVYSANFGNYRNELNKGLDNGIFNENIDYYFFTDNKTLTSKKWKINVFSELDNIDESIMSRSRWLAKYVKFYLPSQLKSYDYVVWVDSKLIPIKINYDKLLKLIKNNPSKRIFNKTHSQRSSAQEELEITTRTSQENKQNGLDFLNLILKDFQSPFKLIETSSFIRKVDKETEQVFNECFNLLKLYRLKRDQNVYNYAFHIKKYPIEYMHFQYHTLNIN
jgi:hypothetical protein